jgi:WD40 repeat protein
MGHALSIALSSNDAMVAVGGAGSIEFLDISRGIRLPAIVQEEGTVATQLAFCAKDKILCATEMDHVVGWHVSTRRMAYSIPCGEDEFEATLCSSDDGSLIVVASRNVKKGGGKALICHADDGTLVRQLLFAYEPLSIALSPNNKLLAVAEGSGWVSLYDLQNKTIAERIDAHGGLRKLVFSPDGRFLAGGGSGPVIRVWQTAGWTEHEPPIGHSDAVRAIRFAPTGRQLVSGGEDKQVIVWDPQSGGILSKRHLQLRATSLSLSPDGKLLACGMTTGVQAPETPECTLALCQMPSLQPALQLKGRQGNVSDIAFSPDGRWLASASGSHPYTLRLWQMPDGLVSQEIEKRAMWRRVAFSHRGEVLASTSWPGNVFLWKAPSGQLIKQLNSLHGPAETAWGMIIADGSVNSLDWSNDDQSLVTADNKGCIFMFDALTGGNLRLLGKHDNHANDAVFAPDCRSVASCGADGTVRVWEVASGRERCQFRGHKTTVEQLSFSPDGRILSSASRDGTILLWDLWELCALGMDAHDQSAWAKLWTQLGDKATPIAYQAMRQFVGGGDSSVAFLSKKLSPAKSPKSETLTNLIAALDSDSFEERRVAERKLASLRELAELSLQQAYMTKRSPQIRELLEKLHAAIDDPEKLRALRAVETLERIGSENARLLLSRLASGESRSVLTQDAKHALQRLQTNVRKKAG